MSEQQATAWDDEATNAAVRDDASVAGDAAEGGRAETGTSRGRKRGARIASVVAVAAVVLLALAAALAPSPLPISSLLEWDTKTVAASVIFAASYLALAIGRVPGLSIDRAGIALVGACLMVASGALPLDDAYKAIDFNTITLLLGMMIVVANLRLSGFFALANAWVVAPRPHDRWSCSSRSPPSRAYSPRFWSMTRFVWCWRRWCSNSRSARAASRCLIF